MLLIFNPGAAAITGTLAATDAADSVAAAGLAVTSMWRSVLRKRPLLFFGK